MRIKRKSIGQLVGALLAVLPVQGQDLTGHRPPTTVGHPQMESRIARLALSAPAGKTLALPLGVRTTQDGQVIVIMEPPPGLEASAIDIKGLEQIGAE